MDASDDDVDASVDDGVEADVVDPKQEAGGVPNAGGTETKQG